MNGVDAVEAARAIGAIGAVDAVPAVTGPRGQDGQDRRRQREQARWRASWTKALDDLELDADEAEALLAEEHRTKELPLPAPWTPPKELGPLPLDLRPRADAVLQRQIALAQRIAQALTMNRRQATAVGRIETGGNDSSPRPAYLDYSM